MNWNRLRDFKCPECNVDLEQCNLAHVAGYKCPECTFTIGEKKFAEIINKPKKKDRYYQHNDDMNMDALNEL